MSLQDMRKSECTLAQILHVGQWKSSAFLRYIDEAACHWKRCHVQRTIGLRLPHACLLQDVALAVAIESDGEEEWID